jgi:hypothetical protein
VPPRLTKAVLLQGLEDAGTSFERGELAYLVVTSKVEFPVRDRFAWELHRRLEDRSHLVAREWKRADGLDVVVDAWLVGPISRPQLEQEAFSAVCVEGESLPDP